MKNMTLTNIARACSAELKNAASNEREKEITCAVIDSRQIEEGGLFFAVKGEKVDGHRFIGQVFEKGAACVVTTMTPDEVEEAYGIAAASWGPYILVEDTLRALRKVASFYRSCISIPVVGITGSVGKTSTKEFVAGVLSVRYRVLKTEGNFNNEIGLPLTLLRIREEHEAAVVEMGISDFGEMSRLGEMARPDICVITNIGQCHLENLHSREGIFRAKTEIFHYMQKDGEVCLNGEDDLLAAVTQVNGKRVHHFGISDREGFDVYASDIENLGLLGSRAVLNLPEGSYPIEISLPGMHMVINATAAALVGRLLGMTPEKIQQGIKNVVPVGGRSNLIRLDDKLVIDDCYNANPVSMKAAIDLLSTTTGRKVAVLGDMFELGEREDRLHAEIGTYAVQQGLDAVYCVGTLSRYMYDAALEAYDGTQDVRYFADREELLNSLPDLLQPDDTVLVKASHGMGFAKVVEALKEMQLKS